MCLSPYSPTAKTERKSHTHEKEKLSQKHHCGAAAVVFVLAGVIGFGTYQKANKVVSTVALDVNPGIEITVNAKEKVLDVKAMNDDAKKLSAT